MQEEKSPLVVADTNVLISALIGKELRWFLHGIQSKYFIPVFSSATLYELSTVLKRPKLAKYITRSEVNDFFELLNQYAIHVKIMETITICRDDKDNIFLECAVVIPADYIISGDSDLLVLHPYRGIPIVSPKSFQEIITSL